MSATVKEEITGWIKERLEDVEQEGQLAIVGLLHFDGHGRENEIFSMKAGSGNWGKVEVMGESFYRYAQRHAHGLVGAQQFQLIGTYGSSTKASRFLPFGLAGMLQFGSVAGGGLSTEPPTDVGARQQGMRLAELVTQGMLAQINPTFHVQANLIDRLMRRLAESDAENRELFVALRQELERTVQLAHERRLKELEFLRATEERRRLIQIMPALANAMTGKEIFPTSTEDSALIETLCANVSEKEIQMFASVLGQKSPELSGLMMARFQAIQQRKREEQEELRRLASEATGGTYEQGERDAIGRTTRNYTVHDPNEIDLDAMPAPPPPAAPPAKEVTSGSALGADVVLDTMLEALSDSEIDQIAMLFAAKRPDVPGLVDEIKKRYETLKLKKAKVA